MKIVVAAATNVVVAMSQGAVEDTKIVVVEAMSLVAATKIVVAPTKIVVVAMKQEAEAIMKVAVVVTTKAEAVATMKVAVVEAMSLVAAITNQKTTVTKLRVRLPQANLLEKLAINTISKVKVTKACVAESSVVDLALLATNQLIEKVEVAMATLLNMVAVVEDTWIRTATVVVSAGEQCVEEAVMKTAKEAGPMWLVALTAKNVKAMNKSHPEKTLPEKEATQVECADAETLEVNSVEVIEVTSVETIVVVAEATSKKEAEAISKEEAEATSKKEAEAISKEEAEAIMKVEVAATSKEEAEATLKEEAEATSKEEAEAITKEEAEAITKEEAEAVNHLVSRSQRKSRMTTIKMKRIADTITEDDSNVEIYL